MWHAWHSILLLAASGVIERNAELLPMAIVPAVVYGNTCVGAVVLYACLRYWRGGRLEILLLEYLTARETAAGKAGDDACKAPGLGPTP